MDEQKALRDQINATANALPSGSEIQRVLLNLDDPANDRASKDRYIALVAGNAVHRALVEAIAVQTSMAAPGRDLIFSQAAQAAEKRGVINADERITIDWIREVRNAFAHATAPISFDTEPIPSMVQKIFHHPITDWASYFAPVFPAREHYAIACGEFCKKLLGGATNPH